MSVSDFCMPWRQRRRRRRRRQWRRRRWQRRWRRRCIKYPANIRRRTKDPKRTNSGKKVTQQLGWKFSSYQPIIIIIFVAAFNSFSASSLEMCFLIFLTLSLPISLFLFFLFFSLCTQSMYLLFVSHSLIPFMSPSTSLIHKHHAFSFPYFICFINSSFSSTNKHTHARKLSFVALSQLSN